MKTTIELPDELLREAKATAAREGKSLKELFTAALRDHLDLAAEPGEGGEPWRRVFGRAPAAAVRAVDEAISDELEQVDLESWR